MGMDVWVNVCLSMLFFCTGSGPWRNMSEEHLPSFLAVAYHHTGQEEDKWTKASCLVSWGFYSVSFRSVYGWVGMDVLVNVFTMPFLCTDSGTWRKMSRAWPAMSAITTSSGSTWPNHQESAWGAAEARQEKVILEVVRKGIIAGRCSIICWTHLLMFSVSTVGEKASDVGAVLRSICQAFWHSPTTTLDRKRTTKRRRHVWWVEGFALCFRSVHGWMGMHVWVNVFTIPIFCADSGP